MPHLSISLLSGFEVRLDGEPLTALGSDRIRALLAYLVMESARPHRRSELSEMFWSNVDEKKAAHNLSQSLLRLRQALHEKTTRARSKRQPFLLITRQDVQFNPLADYELDVATFSQWLQSRSQHHHADMATCSVCMQWLAQAARLYRGDLLAGFFIRDSFGFEEWRLARQETLHRQAVEALASLTLYHERRSEYAQVKEYAQRHVTLEPWSEQPYVQLMRALVRTGQPTAALKQYETYRETLGSELGMEPTGEATALYEEIKQADSNSGNAKHIRQTDTHRLGAHGERRQVTALVCGHPMRDPARDSEELVYERVAVCRHQCESIVSRWGGYRMRHQWNECLILFGYPRAMEDAARRAVDAGLAITQATESAARTSVGIHTGIIIEGERRGQRLEDRELFGDMPSFARMCQGLADPGKVLVTQATMRLVPGSFNFEPVETTARAGLPQPLRVYHVTRTHAAPNRPEWLAQTNRLTTFVGRERELNQLMECRHQVRCGQGQIVLIDGEPGIGKSRLLFELRSRFLEQHQDLQPVSVKGTPTWVEVRCLPDYQNTSLYPIIRVLEKLAGFESEDSLDLKRTQLARLIAEFKLASSAEWLLSALLGVSSPELNPQTITAEQRARMREIFIALLQKQAVIHPLVLVIEDLHWSDPSTLEWLGHSFDSLAEIPCLMLLTYRSSFTPPWLSNPHLVSISLEPLTRNQTEQMVASLVADSNLLGHQVRKHIALQSDGIPLFVEELTEATLENQSIQGVASAKILIPATLQDSLLARLDHVGTAKETAQWAAIIGRDFSYSVLRAVVVFDEQRLQSDLARLIEAGLVGRANQKAHDYSFKHKLVQEAAYASLVHRTRQDYHRRIAEALEAKFPKLAKAQPEVLAQHYANAGLSTQALEYWLQAGEQATMRGATQEAQTFFERALELIDPGDYERRWRALCGREAVLNMQGDRANQKVDLAALLELAQVCQNDTWQAEAYLRQADCAGKQGDYRATIPLADAASTFARRADNWTLELRAQSYKAQSLIFFGEQVTAHTAIEKILAHTHQVENNSVRAQCLTVAAHYYLILGDLVRAVDLQSQGIDAAQQDGKNNIALQHKANLGLIYVTLGLYAQAQSILEEVLSQTEQLGDRRLYANTLFHLGYVYWRNGNDELAQKTEEQALEELKSLGDAYGEAACRAYLGYIFQDMGNYAMALEYLNAARTGFTNIGVDPDRYEAQAVEAHVALTQEQKEAARQLAIEVWQYIRQNGTNGMIAPYWTYLCIADVLAAGEASESVPSVREVVEVGYRELMENANKISNAAWRQAFLENSEENRELVERWKKMQQCE